MSVTDKFCLVSYDEVIAKAENNNLLLGNGFGMSFDPQRFKFDNLFDKAEFSETEVNLFTKLETKPDFEKSVYLIQKAKALLEFIDQDIPAKFNDFEESIKVGLKKAVHNVHFKEINKDKDVYITDFSDNQVIACANFLKPYLSSGSNIFTTNYDLLLYCLLMKIEKASGDLKKQLELISINLSDWGDRFFLNKEPNTYSPEFDDKKFWASDTIMPHIKADPRISYLHGALNIFEYKNDWAFKYITISEAGQTRDQKIVSVIENQISQGNFPLTVVSGTANGKLSQISQNKYLKACYERLEKFEGVLFILGSSIADNDSHLWECIDNNKNITHVYIGFHGSDSHVKVATAAEKHFKLKHVSSNVSLFDSSSIKIWES